MSWNLPEQAIFEDLVLGFQFSHNIEVFIKNERHFEQIKILRYILQGHWPSLAAQNALEAIGFAPDDMRYGL